MGKKYTNSEVMEMLEKNPELEFKLSIFRAFVAAGGDVVIADKRSGENDYHFNVSDEWELVKPEEHVVTFMDATRAFYGGKAIYCIISGKKHDFPCKQPFLLELTPNEILYGKWYVKEE